MMITAIASCSAIAASFKYSKIRTEACGKYPSLDGWLPEDTKGKRILKVLGSLGLLFQLGVAERKFRFCPVFIKDLTGQRHWYVPMATFEIEFSGPAFADGHVAQLVSKLPSLEGIALIDCASITDRGLLPLSQLKNLRVVVIKGMTGTTLEGIQQFPCSFKFIQQWIENSECLVRLVWN